MVNNYNRTLTNIMNGLVLYLPLDEGSGNTAYDESANLNNGTIYDATWVDGKYGKALSFDGVSNYVNIPYAPSLNLTTAITLEAWVKAEYVAFYQFIVSKGDGQSFGYELFLWDNGQVLFDGFYNSANYFYLRCGPDLRDNLWHHIVGTYDKNTATAKVYIDGSYVAQETHEEGIINNPVVLKIGMRDDWAPFKGIIDEVRIYNRALTQDEITTLYNSGPASEIIGNLDSLPSYIKKIFKELNDSIGEIENKIKTIYKTISDIIGGVDSKVKEVSKFLVDIIGNTESKFRGIGRIFADKIGQIEIKIKNVSKILSGIIGDRDWLISSFAEAFTRTLTEVLGMVDTHTGVRHYIRVFLEKTGMKHKYNSLKNWYRYWFHERPRQRVNRE